MPDDEAKARSDDRNKVAMLKILENALTDHFLLSHYRKDEVAVEIVDGAVMADVHGIVFNIKVEVES